ncbi:MAG: Si-specific NAD(P)(+) transhydrogenase [bacterium]|nr:Si-specific NAD(P)(+) transhydrogenase [bacterium]
MERKYQYDMIVIGSGPAGQRAAIQALKLGKTVAVIERYPQVGGVSLHQGTIPSKSFREAIMHLSGYRERSHYGSAYRVKYDIEMDDLTERTHGIKKEIEQTFRSQLHRNNAHLLHGYASFLEPNTVKVRNGATEQVISGEYIVIATGTRPWRPDSFNFDHEVILDSDDVLNMTTLPKSICVVGGGVIGTEYGSMFSALGVKVTIVEQRPTILSFVDQELVDCLVYNLRMQKTQIIGGEKVVACAKSPDGRAVTYLDSGKRIVSEKLLISAGRVGNVEGLKLETIGVEADNRGKITVNENYQTSIPNIYAVGDIIGFPSLASTSMEQGRRAACHAFRISNSTFTSLLPYGIYSIPEIGMVGETEQQLSLAKVPYETGIARFSEVERGRIIGENIGILKLLFHRCTHQLLGVHAIGEGATELVHIGQTVMGFGGGIDYLVDAVFNYPTLAQAYKTAALDGMNKVIATDGLPDEVPTTDFSVNGVSTK